jgi:hypothetical protein
LQPKRGPLGLVRGDYIMFFLLKLSANVLRINVSFPFVCL